MSLIATYIHQVKRLDEAMVYLENSGIGRKRADALHAELNRERTTTLVSLSRIADNLMKDEPIALDERPKRVMEGFLTYCDDDCTASACSEGHLRREAVCAIDSDG